jgi:GT2 family glycosyltransferase
MTPQHQVPIGRADDVSVAIVTYRSGATLGRCLAALKAQTLPGFQTILADNASMDGAARVAASADSDIMLLELGANLGFAAGNNRAARVARGRWLVLLNPDAYAAPDFLERMLAAARDHPHARCFTARQTMAADPARLDGLGDAMTAFGFPFRAAFGALDPGPLPIAEVFSPCGAAMMIDRALFLELGGFDERFFCYCEDADLGYRLRLIGEPVLLAPEAVVAHEGSASTGGRRSDFSLYHGARNRLWLYLKNTPPLLLALTAPLHAAATASMALRAVLRRERATLRGLRDGLRGAPGIWRGRSRRSVASAAIMGMMTWSPLDIIRRRGRMRPSRPCATPRPSD